MPDAHAISASSSPVALSPLSTPFTNARAPAFSPTPARPHFQRPPVRPHAASARAPRHVHRTPALARARTWCSTLAAAAVPPPPVTSAVVGRRWNPLRSRCCVPPLSVRRPCRPSFCFSSTFSSINKCAESGASALADALPWRRGCLRTILLLLLLLHLLLLRQIATEQMGLPVRHPSRSLEAASSGCSGGLAATPRCCSATCQQAAIEGGREQERGDRCPRMMSPPRRQLPCAHARRRRVPPAHDPVHVHCSVLSAILRQVGHCADFGRQEVLLHGVAVTCWH